QRQRQDRAAARASSVTLNNEKLLTHVSRQLCHICLPVSFTSAGTSVAVVFLFSRSRAIGARLRRGSGRTPSSRESALLRHTRWYFGFRCPRQPTPMPTSKW
ncbi:unnamed protein product, partial [Pylaiella littoralis]